MFSPDVTGILDDSELGGGVSFQVTRPRQIRKKGSVELDNQVFTATGNIQPVDLSAMQGQMEDQLNEQIVIRTTFHLQSGTRDASGVYQADEVSWHDARWRVLRVDDWADWGFVTAYATRVRE